MKKRVWVSISAGFVMLAAGVGSTARAQSTVSLYGVADVYMGTQRALGASRAYAMNSGGMSTSFWGLGGKEDLGGGYTALFALEAFMRPSNGAAGRYGGDTFFGRNAYVGLGSRYGSALLGRNTTPYYLSAIRFNPFGGSFGFSPALNQMYKGVAGQGLVGDNSWNNSILYATPPDANLNASLIYGSGNQAGHPGANQWGGNLIYGRGPFAATLAYQQAKYDVTPGDLSAKIAGFNTQRALLAGISYDAGVVRLTAFYQNVHDSIDSGNLNTNSGQLGASVPLGNGALLASCMYAKSKGRGDPMRATWALGYDYRLSKRTDVYAAYLHDRASGYSTGGSAGLGLRTSF